MPLDTMALLLALGLMAAVLAGNGPGRPLPRLATPRLATPRLATPRMVTPRMGTARVGTPDDGPIGLGAGRTARCPLCERTALELVGVGTTRGRDVPLVRCGHCRSSYTVRGTLSSVPAQRPSVG